MDLGVLQDVVLGLLPTIGVTLLFGIAILAIVRADAGEREDRARIEAEEDAAAAAAAAERRTGRASTDDESAESSQP